MAIFQESIVQKHLSNLDGAELDLAFKRYKEVYGVQKIENIKKAKEEQYQEGFIKDIFGQVLGYSIFPEQPFNIQTETKNATNSKKADGAIFQGENVVGVIELKDNKTRNLDAVKDQAFGYKNNHKDCSYVISSNFHKLRFYIDDATEYEEFDLYNLDLETFKRFYLYLRKEGLLDKDIPKLLRQETKFHEENITKSLYKDYSGFKSRFYENTIKNNPQFDKVILFKKSQKFLDKLLFVLFAEDKGLIKTNSIVSIVEKWQSLKEDAFDDPKPLYQLVNFFFGNLYRGKKDQNGNTLVPEFGGEIFAPDEVLDNITIDDSVLKNDLLKLSQYDFNTDVDVNILGHIFEHSLSEIEEVEASLSGVIADKTKGKRKKDGVFYTPKYITKFIVDNTLGRLCIEKKTELGLDADISVFDFQKSDGKLNAKGIHLYEKINEYKKWLMSLKIVDPACGSGAFLNEALNFLIEEHQYFDDLIAELTTSPLRLFDTDIAILENNIYGVDINEESVEIAKLSLWLRTARPGRKLSNLSNNIKCGNSLIDDPDIASDKAFNWKNEFPEVFAMGGFDVVIGNPPYVRQELFKDIKPSLEKNYKCYNSVADLYTYFIELGIRLMNNEGKFSFILPNKFLKASYGEEIRNVIKQNTNLELLFDFDDYPVFDDATTYPIIYVLNKNKNYSKDYFIYSEINKKEITNDPLNLLVNKSVQVKYTSLKDKNWQFQDDCKSKLLNKIISNATSLKEIVNDRIYRGVSTGKNEVFIIDKNIADKLINDKNKSYIRKIVTGKEVKKNNLTFDDLYLLYIPWEYDLEYDENIKNYLINNQESLANRPEVKEGRFNWWCLSRYGSKNAEYLFKPKIIYPRINNQCNFYFDSTGEYSLSDNNFFISTENSYILPILNSKLIFFYLKSIASTLQGGYLDFRRPYIETIPIQIPSNISNFEEISNTIIIQNNDFQQLVDKFQRIIQRKFELQELPKKLQDWYKLSYTEFIKELAKKKVNLSLSQEAEWEDYFTSESQKALELKSLIDQTDQEIDRMVYELYNLTTEEIKIVENAF